MRLALLPGFILALVAAVWSNNSSNSINPALLHTSTGLYSVAAQATITATTAVSTPTPAATSVATAAASSAVTSTQSVTSTVAPVSTPVPLPTVGPQAGGIDFTRIVDWNYLTTVPFPPLGPLGWLFLALMVILFGVGAYFFIIKRPQWKGTNTVLRKAAERWGSLAMYLAGGGFLLLLFRLIGFPLFNIRLWLYLWLLVIIGVVIWFAYWYRADYPKQLERYQKAQRQRQYMPTVKKGGARVPVPAARPVTPQRPVPAPTPKPGATGGAAAPSTGQTSPPANRPQSARAKRRRH